MTVTDAMVEAALRSWYGSVIPSDTANQNMRAALEAALQVAPPSVGLGDGGVAEYRMNEEPMHDTLMRQIAREEIALAEQPRMPEEPTEKMLYAMETSCGASRQYARNVSIGMYRALYAHLQEQEKSRSLANPAFHTTERDAPIREDGTAGERDALLCSCHRCVDARIMQARADGAPLHMTFPGPSCPGWRYGCHQCGNKRCPHHTDHRLVCTNSNKPGQPGSDYQ